MYDVPWPRSFVGVTVFLTLVGAVACESGSARVPNSATSRTGPERLADPPHARTWVTIGEMDATGPAFGQRHYRGLALAERMDSLRAGEEGMYGFWGAVNNASPGSRFAVGGHFVATSEVDSHTAEGVAGVARISAAISVNEARGLFGSVKTDHPTGNAQIARARAAWLRNSYAAKTEIEEVYGAFVELDTLGPDSLAQRYYGVFIDSTPETGRIANGFGLYLTDVTGADRAYGIYQAGADDHNFLAGGLGIGHEQPRTALDVAGDIVARHLLIDLEGETGSLAEALPGSVRPIGSSAATAVDVGEALASLAAAVATLEADNRALRNEIDRLASRMTAACGGS